MKAHNLKTDVAVLGAGLAGLAAADELTRKGREVVVIEKETEAGGMCRSFKCDGFTFDLGGHRFLSHNQQTTDYVDSLFNEDERELVLRNRRSEIRLKGKYLIYPPEILDLLKQLGPVTCLRAGIDSLYFRLNQFIRKEPEVSLKDWLMNRFGPTLYDIYFGPYSVKLWGRAPNTISKDWAPQRISVPNIAVVIKNMFMNNKRPKTFASQFLYPKGGIGELSTRIARKITSRGARIYTDHRVVGISSSARGLTITALTKEGNKVTFIADKLVSTIPLNEFMASLAASLQQDVIDSAATLRFRSVRFLNLMLDSNTLTDNTWIYVPEREFIFFRIQELPHWHPSNCPAGKTALTLEVACEKGGRLWGMKEEDLVSFCLRDLAQMGIHIKDKMTGHFCTYAEHAYPVYSLKYRQYLCTIYNSIKDFKNITLAGRQGLFRYLNMDTAIENGILGAESLYDEDLRQRLLTLDADEQHVETGLILKANGR